jgi:nitroreductase / dihydropteridine reductase
MESVPREKLLIEALLNRYACKKFDRSKKLSTEQVETLVESVRLTATSYGLQLMKVVIVEEENVREQLMKSSYDQPQVCDASHLFVLCREGTLDEEHFEDYVANISGTREIPREKLDQAKSNMMSSILSKSYQDQKYWMEKQVYIALGNLLASCAILGIDACPMEGFVPSEYDDILDLSSKNLSSVLVCPVGYRSTEDANATLKKVRRSTDNFVVKV